MNFSNSKIEKISVAYVGNKLHGERLTLPKKQLQLNGIILEKLTTYFLNKFNNIDELFSFSHSSALKFNEVYNYCKDIFTGEKSFISGAASISSHLYEQSIHPKVIGGEVYVCLFKNCIVSNESTNAIGIFKTENKTGFFDVNNDIENFVIDYKEGLDINRLDKGCIIFDKEVRGGYILSIIDSQSKGSLAQYWKNDFLNVKEKSDNFHFTKNYLSVTKDFIIEELDEKFNLSKVDQTDLLNKSIGYFKENKEFNSKDFEKTVFNNSEIIKSFQKFGSQYLDDNKIDISDKFEISQSAVKKQARNFKNVIKLDKNFHIYIHGNRDLLQQGIEKDGRKFYKLYFENEM